MLIRVSNWAPTPHAYGHDHPRPWFFMVMGATDNSWVGATSQAYILFSTIVYSNFIYYGVRGLFAQYKSGEQLGKEFGRAWVGSSPPRTRFLALCGCGKHRFGTLVLMLFFISK